MKKRYLLTAALVVPLILFWFFVLFRPLDKNQKRIIQQLAESESKVENYRKTMYGFPAFFESQRKLLEQKEHLLSKLYSKNDLVRLFKRFEQLAKDYNLKLVEITPSVDELLELNYKLLKDNDPQVLNIEIRMLGSLIDAGRYIEKIEEEDYYFGINYCRINNPPPAQIKSEINLGFNAILGTLRDK